MLGHVVDLDRLDLLVLVLGRLAALRRWHDAARLIFRFLFLRLVRSVAAGILGRLLCGLVGGLGRRSRRFGGLFLGRLLDFRLVAGHADHGIESDGCRQQSNRVK